MHASVQVVVSSAMILMTCHVISLQIDGKAKLIVREYVNSEALPEGWTMSFNEGNDQRGSLFMIAIPTQHQPNQRYLQMYAPAL